MPTVSSAKCLAMLLLLLIPIERVNFSSPFRLINPHVAFLHKDTVYVMCVKKGIMSFTFSVTYLFSYKVEKVKEKQKKKNCSDVICD